MTYTITGRAVLDLLAKENLLISADAAFEKLCFRSVFFDSRETNPDGLFFTSKYKESELLFIHGKNGLSNNYGAERDARVYSVTA